MMTNFYTYGISFILVTVFSCLTYIYSKNCFENVINIYETADNKVYIS